MVIAFVLLWITVSLFVALAVRLGAKVARLQLRFRRALVLACWLVAAPWLVWLGLLLLVEDMPTADRQPILVVAGLVVLLLTFPFLQRALRASFARTLVAWSLQAVVQLLVFAAVLASMEDSARQYARAEQKRTLADIRNTGTAIMSWAIDQPRREDDDGGFLPEPQAGSVFDVTTVPRISFEELQGLLHPSEDLFYLTEVPQTDGWGHPFEYRLHVEARGVEVRGSPARAVIRSPGRDGVFQGERYEVGPFDPLDYDQDLVWVDGFLVRWPEKAETGNELPDGAGR